MSVETPRAKRSAHAKAPLCSQQYESMATQVPLGKSRTFVFSDAFSMNGIRPVIPMAGGRAGLVLRIYTGTAVLVFVFIIYKSESRVGQ